MYRATSLRVLLRSLLISTFSYLILFCSQTLAIKEIIKAINAGGQEHVDKWGIRYEADPLRKGVPSDYGRRYLIGRVPPDDQPLYQTERYNTGNFEYTFQMDTADGDYVAVLKFSEVYFNGPREKVFSIAVNDHMVINDLDIYDKAGGIAIAHEEILPFSVKNKQLRIAGETSGFDGTLTITFIKGDKDNPKVNAFYVMRGTVEDIPPMPPLETQDDEVLPRPEETVTEEPESTKPKFASGPQMSDPYAQQEVSQMFIPILIALACFFPVLFCLCRL